MGSGRGVGLVPRQPDQGRVDAVTAPRLQPGRDVAEADDVVEHVDEQRLEAGVELGVDRADRGTVERERLHLRLAGLDGRHGVADRGRASLCRGRVGL